LYCGYNEDMHHIKGLLITVVIVCFSAIGIAIVAGLGLVPQSVYSFIYSIEKDLGIGGSSTLPYLQKFEGYWDMKIEPSIVESELGKCMIVQGSVRIKEGKFSGSLGPFGSSVGIQAKVAENGTWSGTFSTAGVHKGTLQGKLVNGKGEGVWVDNYECKGTVALTKLDPVEDPVQGTITSMTGEVRLVRGGQPRWAVAGEVLYVGDKVEVGTNSEATVIMKQSGKTTVPAGAEFTVPELIHN